MMEPTTESFYQLVGKYYFGDGQYLWEDIGGPESTVKDALRNRAHAERDVDEYVDFMVEYRVITTVVVVAPSDREL